jgi:hypothetical protein
MVLHEHIFVATCSIKVVKFCDDKLRFSGTFHKSDATDITMRALVNNLKELDLSKR